MNMGNRLRRMVAVVLVLLLAAAMVLCGGCGKKDKAQETATSLSEENVVEDYVDAQKYFEESGNIQEVLSAKDSKDVKTEKAVIEDFAVRGFDQLEITYNYSMDGELTNEAVVNKDSTEKHPMYQALYATKSEMVWSITVVNGAMMANPISYNATAESDVPVLLAENETLTSYDVATNQFFVTVPKAEAVLVKTVDKIDAATLESLTKEGIDAL